MINITIEQIQYFLAIKKNNGFSSAAHELCISQSSLSKQIKSLEIELDTILFERTSRTVNLTPAGEDFYTYAQSFLNEYKTIIQKMKKHSFSNKKTLNIGSIAVITQYGLASALASFKQKHPQFDLHILEDENEAVLEMLTKSEIDFAIVRDFNLSRELFDVTHLAEDKLVVVTSSSHPFTKKKFVTFADLQNEDLIICSKSGVYDICMYECSKLNFTPNIIYKIRKIETILGLVSENLGITLMVSNVLKPFKSLDICVHHLEHTITSNLALVTLKSNAKKKDFSLFKESIQEHTSK